MSVYKIDGSLPSSVYGKSGSQLIQAYDKNGNPLLTPPVQPKLVVMSYNVQWFTAINSNQAMQEEIINTYNPHIIGLQEIHNPIGTVGSAVLSGYDYFEYGIQTNLSGIASKILLDNATAGVFEHQANEIKGYQKAYLTFDGKQICWVNAHLDVSLYESTKVAQAAEVFSLVQNEPYFIITGDFNTVCKSVNDTEYTTIMKQFVDAGYNCANCTTQHGFLNTWTSGSTAGGTWYPCDHIITSANISIVRVIVDERKIAIAAETGQSIDHLPIIAELTIN